MLKLYFFTSNLDFILVRTLLFHVGKDLTPNRFIILVFLFDYDVQINKDYIFINTQDLI
jgi:hypothetical protein